MRRLFVTGLVVALAAVGGAAERGDAAAKPVALKRFAGCGALLGYAKRHGLETVGPWGFGGAPAVRTGIPTPVAAAPASGRESDAPEHSKTNVQETGIDEPDLVKSDGNRILAIAQGKLRYIDVRGAKPRLRDSLALQESYGHQIFMHGDRALVISNVAGPIPLLGVRIGPAFEKTVLSEVDLRDPDALRVVRTVTVDGGFLNARLHGATARIVLRTFPRLPFEQPPPNAPEAKQQVVEQRNEQAISRSTVQSWLPRYTVRAKGKTRQAGLARCRDVRYPSRFSGLGLLTVLTLDLDKSIEPVDSDAVMTNGEIVYASSDNLFVATQTWLDPEEAAQSKTPPEVETALHAFDVSDAKRTDYRGSGRVRGYLLNQWSLSEYRSALRVASTTMPAWWPNGQAESESMVTVLKQQSGKLVQVGQVGGLGRGERILGVRFIDDAGYVVTFRQVDPLYTLDLSNPEKPAVRGELKLLGYSAYLHPVGEDLLLGVGQDATDRGQALGTQVSLFDVSDLRKPARLDNLTISRGSSEVEFDHHAFLYWPKTRLAMLPVQTETGSVALGVRVSRARGVTLAGKLTHEGGAQIRRALVVDKTLYTISDAGVKASDLDSLDDRAWLPFKA